MSSSVPNYYGDFKCIASDCKNNCCIGWEIDIDALTFDFYKGIKGEFGDKIRKNIAHEPSPHFLLGENDRCPFLEKNGLCEIINNLSQTALCQICSDHPRFRNFLPSGEEIGLGLCCEAAAELILGQKEKFEIKTEVSDSFINFRQKIFDILQNDNKEFPERLEEMLSLCGGKAPRDDINYWQDVYKNLERLDSRWDTYLEKLKKPYFYKKFQKIYENLACYFVFRHFSLYNEGYGFDIISSFVVLSVFVIAGLIQENSSFEDIVAVVRMYSSEIEYSEENMEDLLTIIES